MQAGFGKIDITPRVGVELCGFGPYLNRNSKAVRDPLSARAMAVHDGDNTCVIASCDLIGVPPETTAEVRRQLHTEAGLSDEQVMVHCTHTHSGPGTGVYIGWGEPDPPYMEILPNRIAEACKQALANLQDVTFSHCEVPCEGIGLNREHERFRAEFNEIADESWRPERPDLTDTTCHVIRIDNDEGLLGFLSYFGCHPVVGAVGTHYIHGDYPGIATNLLERESPGCTGLFLQGALGDVNSCIVGKEEKEALPALDILASRYARAVRTGLREAKEIEAAPIRTAQIQKSFSRKNWDAETLKNMIAEQEKHLNTAEASDAQKEVRHAVVHKKGLQYMLDAVQSGNPAPPMELHGIRIGPMAFLGTPFEIQQAIKTDICNQAQNTIPFVMAQTNAGNGYAVDSTVEERGGYAAEKVPFICGFLPYTNMHEELKDAVLELDAQLS